MVLKWHISSTAMLLLHIRTVLEWLGESADWADDVLIGVHGEWEDWDEAEGEPVPTLLDVGCVVPAVMALTYNRESK